MEFKTLCLKLQEIDFWGLKSTNIFWIARSSRSPKSSAFYNSPSPSWVPFLRFHAIWGLRVIIPPKFQKQVLSVLHEAHPGVARMKAMSRSHVWWPKLDTAIEETVKSCRQCVNIKSSPPAALLSPWITTDTRRLCSL